MSQFPEEVTASSFEVAKQLSYQGAARVSLKVLRFGTYQSRELNLDHVEHLKRCFRSEGCQRLLPQNHVPAIISRQELSNAMHASQVSDHQLLDGGVLTYRTLDFPAEVHLECLHGQHRIAAGRETLLPTDQWWVVDLYLSDLDPGVRSCLIEEYAHERHPTDGEVYQKLRQYDAERNLESKLRWKARLQGIRPKSLNTLYKHEDLTHAFDDLLDIPGLWHGLKLSTIHKLFPLRCNEEIVHYLRHIKIFWSGLVQGNRDAMSRIDEVTVQALQSRAPRASTMDAKIVRSQIRAGEIFSRFDERERDDIWSRLQTSKGLIPTIRTLFKDIQYLEQCVNCVKRLTTISPRESLTQALKRKFKGVHQRQGHFKVQISEGQFIYKPGTSEDQVDCGYRQIYAFAMRHWPDMPKEPEKEDPQMKAPTRADPATLRRFADLATALGFESAEIGQLRQYSGTVHTTTGPLQSKPFLVTSGKSIPIKNRSGKPTTLQFKKDSKTLFFHHLHDQQEEQDTNITSLYVRKSVYLAFFGELLESHTFWRDDVSRGSRVASPESMNGDLNESHRSEPAIGDYDNILTLYQQTGFRNGHEVDLEQPEARSTRESEVGRNSTQDESEDQVDDQRQRSEQTSKREQLELQRIEERARSAERLRAQRILDQERQREEQERRGEQERETEEQRRQVMRHLKRHEEEIQLHESSPRDTQRIRRPHTQIDMGSVHPSRHEITASSSRSSLVSTSQGRENDSSTLEHDRLEHERLEHERLEHERLEHERLEHERLESLDRIKSLKELELERSQQKERRIRHIDIQGAHLQQREQARLQREESTPLDRPIASQVVLARPRLGQSSASHAQAWESTFITFKIHERGIWRTSETLQVHPSDTSQVERIAVKYMRKRIRLYDTDLNVLTPQMCYQAAVTNSAHLLLLIPETNIDINTELEASVAQLLSDIGA